MKTVRAIIISLLLFMPATSHGYLIDKVEAVVNGRVITKSEVDRAALAEARRRGMTLEGEGYGKLRAEALDSLIDRMLLLDEARRFNIVQVTGDEVERAYESVKAGFGSQEEFEKALRQEELTEDELKDGLRDQILAVKYVDRRVKFFVRVTLDEQKKYYQENMDRFGGREFSEVHEEVYGLLVERETAKKLEEYMRDLRARSVIKLKGAAGETLQDK